MNPARRGPVVVVVDRFPERSQTFVVNELRQLAARGVDVRPFRLRDPLDPAVEVHDVTATWLGDPATVTRGQLLARLARLVPRWGLGPARALRLLLEDRSQWNAWACRRAVALVERLTDRPAWIHAHFANAPAGVAMFTAAITGAPWSFTGHANDLFVRAEDLDRRLARADLVVDVCAYNRSWLATHHPHDTPHVLVPCGVDLGTLERTTAYEPRPFRVLAVGRLVEKKGFDDLLRAVALLRDRDVACEVEILGDGREGPRLKALAAQLGVEGHVRFAGSVAHEQVRAALEEATLLCLPCVVAANGDRDSQPVVVKEAMAMRLPVVATREVGLPDMVVDGETGRLVPPRDPAAMADALAELAADPDACHRMGQAGRHRVELHFGFDTTIPTLLRAWGLDG